MKNWSSLLAAVLLIGWGAAIRAEDVNAIVSRGIELRRKGRDAEALAEFQRALKIEKSPRVQAQAALAEQALGLWDAAEADLLEAMGRPGDPWIARNRGALNKAMGVIQSHLGSLEIWGTPDGARITVNDKDVGTLPLGKPVRVAGGAALLTARAPGYLDVTRSVEVPAGETVREHVQLFATPPRAPEKEPEAAAAGPASTAPAATSPDGQMPPPTSSRVRPLAWIAAAAAAGGLAFGIVETVIAVQKQNAFNDHMGPNPGDPGGPLIANCTTAALVDECKPLQEAYKRAVTFAIVGYAAGGALAVGSLVLFRMSPEKERQDARVACLPDPGTRGLSCALRF
jgi:hypothetical protein